MASIFYLFKSSITGVFIVLCLLSASAVATQESVEEKRKVSSAGIGLNGISDFSTEFPFIDQMKTSRNWYDWSKNTDEGIELDEHGWVKSFKRGLKPSVVFLTMEDENVPIPYEHYIVRWEGKGSLDYQWCARKVGKAHGGDKVRVNYGSCLLTIAKSDKDDPVRNISIVPEKHIDAFDAGEIFNPDFIEKIGQFRALRFMDWMETNKSEQSKWSERPLPKDRTYVEKGVPAEIMVELANKVLADPWFNMPHQADIDYMTQFAELVKSSLDKKLNVYIEHSNEVWNWIFPQTKFAFDSAKALFEKEGDAWFQWHGMRTAQMCEAWKENVYKMDKDKVVCVLGTQASWPGLEDAALDCPLWVKQGNKPCVDYGLDAIAITGYFSGCLDGGEKKVNRSKIIGWQHTSDKGITKAFEQALDGRHFECEDTVKSNIKNYQHHVTVAKKRGMSVVAYEGGQHITSNLGETQNDKRFINLHIALNRDEKMKVLYAENFKNWIDTGGTLFMHFVDASTYSKYGSWGALEYITQETSPKWEALLEFNQTSCWWENCQ